MKIIDTLKKINLPYATGCFVHGEVPDAPYIVLIPRNDINFSADNMVYYSTTDFDIELYCDRYSPDVENRVENVLNQFEIFYTVERVWIESERYMETIYSFDLKKEH